MQLLVIPCKRRIITHVRGFKVYYTPTHRHWRRQAMGARLDSADDAAFCIPNDDAKNGEMIIKKGVVGGKQTTNQPTNVRPSVYSLVQSVFIKKFLEIIIEVEISLRPLIESTKAGSFGSIGFAVVCCWCNGCNLERKKERTNNILCIYSSIQHRLLVHIYKMNQRSLDVASMADSTRLDSTRRLRPPHQR